MARKGLGVRVVERAVGMVSHRIFDDGVDRKGATDDVRVEGRQWLNFPLGFDTKLSSEEVDSSGN